MGDFTMLTTDACLFALFAVATAYGLQARRHEHLRAPWREVWRRPVAVGASVVLTAFMLVALADSIHFVPRDGADDGEVISMLDVALQSGMRPEQIRELTGTGYRLAKRLGVRLPPRREFGRAG